MKKKYSFLVISFFRVTNPYSGASEVSYNFYKNIPYKDKKLIQFSEFSQNQNNIINVKAVSKIDKLLNIRKLAKIAHDCSIKKSNPIVIIEGASWIGYSFLFYIYLKKKLKHAKFIYHSHNIEYFLRKQKNNLLISWLSKNFENYIAKNVDIFTCVSEHDKKKVKDTYNVKAQILANGIDYPNISKLKLLKRKFDYIFFCGSVEYQPNKEALEILVNKIMPIVNKFNPNLKLLVSGNAKLPMRAKNLINAGFVSKIKFYQILKSSSVFVNPMKTAFGSQVKMISALVFGKTIVASKKATIGLDFKIKGKIFIANTNQDFAFKILRNLKNQKTNLKISKFFQKKYSYKTIIGNFFKKNLI